MIGAFVLFGTIAALIAAEAAAPSTGFHLRGFQLQTVIGFVTPKIIEWMKQSQSKPLQFIQPGNPKAARWVAAVVAAATTVGIGISFTGDFWSADGGTITLAHVSIPFIVSAAVSFISAWVYQWVIQHTSFEMFWKPQPLPAPAPVDAKG